jgi:hypothetical protein
MHKSFLKIGSAIEGFPQYSLMSIVFLVSIVALIPAWMNYDIIARDGAHLYVPVATLFLEGRFHEALFGPLRPLFPLPLYEFLIFVVAKISGLPPEISGRLVSAGSFVLGSVGIFRVSELLLKNREMALLSVLFYLSNKQLLSNSVDCLKEALFVCIIIWGNFFVLMAIVSQQKKGFYYSLGGILLLSGAMVRSTSVVFLGAWLAIWVFHKREGFALRLMVLLVPFITFFAMSYLMPEFPLFRRSLSLKTYLFFLTQSYKSLLEVGNASVQLIFQFLGISQYLMTLFGIVGMYHLGKTPYTKHLVIVFVIFFVLCIGMGWNYSGLNSDRFILAPSLWLIPASSYEIARSIQSRRSTIKCLAILTVVALPFFWANKAFDPPDQDRLARKEAGLWILAQVGPYKDVITNRERIAFYAQGNIITLVNNPSLDKLGAEIAQRYPEGTSIILSDIMDKKSLKKAMVLDTLLDDGKFWKAFLDSLGVKPNKAFRSIYIYLPQRVLKISNFASSLSLQGG